jgi:hypothetical protein
MPLIQCITYLSTPGDTHCHPLQSSRQRLKTVESDGFLWPRRSQVELCLLACSVLWQYDAGSHGKAVFQLVTRYMSVPAPCPWSAATSRTGHRSAGSPAPCWTAPIFDRTTSASKSPACRGRLGSRTKSSPTTGWANPRPVLGREQAPSGRVSRPRESASERGSKAAVACCPTPARFPGKRRPGRGTRALPGGRRGAKSPPRGDAAAQDEHPGLQRTLRSSRDPEAVADHRSPGGQRRDRDGTPGGGHPVPPPKVNVIELVVWVRFTVPTTKNHPRTSTGRDGRPELHALLCQRAVRVAVFVCDRSTGCSVAIKALQSHPRLGTLWSVC